MAGNQTDIICDNAYKYAQMDENGEIYFCCPPWIGGYSIGSIKEQSFNEIWNGEKARKFRRQFIDNNFTICKTDICIRRPVLDNFEYPPTSDIAPKPECFIFNYDSTCNIRCIFCKDECKKTNPKFEYFEENMDSLLEEMLENAKVVVPSTSGESLFSPATVRLIKKINEKFPNIRYSITTNGLLINEENLNKLGIKDRIYQLAVSVHATTKKTYDKLVKYSNFDTIVNNLNYMSDMYRQKKIDNFQMNFVINAYNYKEMADFVKWANKLGANANFWQLLDSNIDKNTFKKLNIFDTHHPKYNDLCEVIKHPIFKTGDCCIPDGIMNLKKVNKSIIENISERIEYAKL